MAGILPRRGGAGLPHARRGVKGDSPIFAAGRGITGRQLLWAAKIGASPGEYRIPDVDEKALYFRAPYSSQAGVKPYLVADRTVLPAGQCIAAGSVLDLTGKLAPDGRLVWDVPAGNWTVLRFGRTATGQTTRPAPAAGLGFESDKFDKAALDAHFAAFIESC